MGKVKDLKRRGRELRLKERRLRAQGGDKSVLAEVGQRGYSKGYEDGVQAGLRQAFELGHEHRRMTWFMSELKKLIGGG